MQEFKCKKGHYVCGMNNVVLFIIGLVCFLFFIRVCEPIYVGIKKENNFIRKKVRDNMISDYEYMNRVGIVNGDSVICRGLDSVINDDY